MEICGIYENWLNDIWLETVKKASCQRIEQLLQNPNIDVNFQDEFNGYTALDYAVERKDFFIVKLLLQQENLKVNVSLRTDGKKFTPLHLACSHYDTPTEIVRILIEKGGSLVNSVDHDNRTPLFLACLNFRLDIVKVLIANGCNLNHRDKLQETVLHCAVRFKNYEAIDYFLDETPINASIRNKFGATPLYLAWKQYSKRTNDFPMKKLIGKTVKMNPETQTYTFEEIFHHSAMAYKKNYTRIFEDFFVPYYSLNNSKYHLIEGIEKYCSTTNILLILTHDQITSGIIEKNEIFDKTTISYGFKNMFTISLISNQSNVLVSELFKHLLSLNTKKYFGNFEIFVCDILETNLIDLENCSADKISRISNIIKIFYHNGLDTNKTLKLFLNIPKCKKFYITRLIPILNIVRALVPLSSNFANIMADYLSMIAKFPRDNFVVTSRSRHGRLRIQRSSDKVKEEIQKFLQDYGDNRKFGNVVRDMKIDLNFYSLKHLCRNVIRDTFLKKASLNNRKFFNYLNSLRTYDSLIRYLKFEDIVHTTGEDEIASKKRKLE